MADDYFSVMRWDEVNFEFPIIFVGEIMAGFQVNDKLAVGPEEEGFFKQFHQFIK